MKKNKRYRIKVSEDQLRMIINCVEDCHRFAGGQVELDNTRFVFKNSQEIVRELKKVKPISHPYLWLNESYDWAGNGCGNRIQRTFIASTYYLYRELLHQWTLMQDADDWNVYKSPTLRCEGSGEVIKLEEV